jgi:hypothetical protein
MVATFARVVSQELGLLRGDRDSLEAGAVAEHGDAAAALVPGLPAFLDCLGPVGLDVLVGRDDAGRDGGFPEELGRVLLGPQP